MKRKAPVPDEVDDRSESDRDRVSEVLLIESRYREFSQKRSDSQRQCNHDTGTHSIYGREPDGLQGPANSGSWKYPGSIKYKSDRKTDASPDNEGYRKRQHKRSHESHEPVYGRCQRTRCCRAFDDYCTPQPVA
jgi:hypothetical protein